MNTNTDTIALPKGGLLLFGKQPGILRMTSQNMVITLNERLSKVVLDPFVLQAPTSAALEDKVQAWVAEKTAEFLAHGPLPGELRLYRRDQSMPSYFWADVVLVAHEAVLNHLTKV
jgi:hypothetical protein